MRSACRLDAPICWLLAAGVPAARLILAWRLKEGTKGKVDIGLIKKQATKMWSTLSHPGIHRPIAFIFLAGATVPNFGSPQNNFITDLDSSGWKAGASVNGVYTEFNASNFGPAFKDEPITCEWVKANDPGCQGNWVDALVDASSAVRLAAADDTARIMSRMVAGGFHSVTVPQGSSFRLDSCTMTPCQCQLIAPDPMKAFAFDNDDAMTYAFDENGDGDVTKEELGAWMHGLGQSPTDGDLQLMLDNGGGAPGMEACVELAAHEPEGIHVTTAAEACSVLVQLTAPPPPSGKSGPNGCNFLLADHKDRATNAQLGMPGVPDGTLVRSICPTFCGAVADVCGVIGGDASSCAAQALSEAWHKCPQACEACNEDSRPSGLTNKKGCLGFSSTFISSLGIIAYAGLAIGTALYSAYLKAVPYHKLLVGAHILLAVISVMDWLTVVAVNPVDATIFGIDAHWFAVFDEAAGDVLYQFKLMPLLVLAAQVCPASIEGTLFAFIMQMSNTGGTYAGYFGSWYSDHLEISQDDFTGLAFGNFIRIFFKLSPILYIWLVPMTNPKDVIAQIDAELTAAEDKAAGKEPVAHDEACNHSRRNVLMPFVLFTLCLGAPAMKTFNMPVTWLAIPVIALMAIPTYETFLAPIIAPFISGADRIAPGLSMGLIDSSAGPVEPEPTGPPPPPILLSELAEPTQL